jgi:steroid delta-isomerase-like uncharacterized protein
MSEQNLATSHRWFELWGQQDWDGLVDMVGDDFIAIDQAKGQGFRGKEGLYRFLRSWADSFDMENTALELSYTAAGNKVVAETLGRGTHTGTYAGVEATGQEVSLPIVIIQTFSDEGRFLSHEIYYDQMALVAQLLAKALPTLESRNLAMAASGLSEMRFPSGATVVTQGDRPDNFYVILTGEVEVIRDGRTVATLGPGQFFGEVGLLHGEPRNATIRALSELTTYALAAEDFAAMIRSSLPTAGLLNDLARQRTPG